MQRATIAGLSVYPVKSCRGVDTHRVHVLPTGLAHDGVRDREWMVVDARGRFLTQREFPDLALVRTVVRDDAAAKSILSNLEKTAAHLESITGKIDRGEGSVGALINDPELYEGLRNVVAGGKKSRLGKGMIRHYEKKGSEERDREAVPADGDNP